MIGRTTYIGFYVDWALSAIPSLAYFITFITCGSMYVGAFIYINGMVAEMKMRLKSIDSANVTHTLKKWSIYVGEIELHNEIIGYLSMFYFFSFLSRL